MNNLNDEMDLELISCDLNLISKLSKVENPLSLCKTTLKVKNADTDRLFIDN